MESKSFFPGIGGHPRELESSNKITMVFANSLVAKSTFKGKFEKQSLFWLKKGYAQGLVEMQRAKGLARQQLSPFAPQ